MSRRTLILSCAGLALVLAAPVAAQTPDFEWTGRVGADGWLKVYSGNGPIEVLPASGDAIEIIGERRPGRRHRDPVRFQVVRAGADVVVCAVAEDGECGPDGLRGQRNRGSYSPERVRFSMRVPRGTNVRLVTGNGELRIEGVGGDVLAHTGNGDVEILGTTGTVEVGSGNGDLRVTDAAGPVRAGTGNGEVMVRTGRGPVSAHSGNGDIVVDVASLEGGDDLEFNTGSGDIELRLPADLDAELVTHLGNGRLTSDFPLTIQGRTNFRNMRAVIGAGGRRIVVGSGNGDAVLRRR